MKRTLQNMGFHCQWLPLTLLSLTFLSVVPGYVVDLGVGDLRYKIDAQESDPTNAAVDIFLTDSYVANSTVLHDGVTIPQHTTVNYLLNGSFLNQWLYKIQVKPHGFQRVVGESMMFYIDPAVGIIIAPSLTSTFIPFPTDPPIRYPHPPPPSLSFAYASSVMTLPTSSSVAPSVAIAYHPTSSFFASEGPRTSDVRIPLHPLLAALAGALILFCVVLCILVRRRRKSRFQLLSEKPQPEGTPPPNAPVSPSSGTEPSNLSHHRYTPSLAPTYETNCPQAGPSSLPPVIRASSRSSDPFYSPADDTSDGRETHLAGTYVGGSMSHTGPRRVSFLETAPACRHASPLLVHRDRDKGARSGSGIVIDAPREGMVLEPEREGDVAENPFADSKDPSTSLFSSYQHSKMEPLPQYEAHLNDSPHILLRNSKTQCFCSSCVT